VPYDTSWSWEGSFADAAVTTASKIVASFGTAPDTEENDFNDLAEMTLAVTPGDGVIYVSITCPGPFGGPIPINYLVG
jgi:hypothetical protein